MRLRFFAAFMQKMHGKARPELWFYSLARFIDREIDPISHTDIETIFTYTLDI